MMEMDLFFQSDSGQIDETHALRQWSRAYIESLTRTNTVHGRKDRQAPKQLDSMMMSAGFTNVQQRVMTLPMSPWSNSEHHLRVSRGRLTLMCSRRRPATTHWKMESNKHAEHHSIVGIVSFDTSAGDVVAGI